MVLVPLSISRIEKFDLPSAKKNGPVLVPPGTSPCGRDGPRYMGEFLNSQRGRNRARVQFSCGSITTRFSRRYCSVTASAQPATANPPIRVLAHVVSDAQYPHTLRA